MNNTNSKRKIYVHISSKYEYTYETWFSFFYSFVMRLHFRDVQTLSFFVIFLNKENKYLFGTQLMGGTMNRFML